MRINQNTKVIGNKVILLPYEAKHVEKYNTWMQSAELQQLTASEPLTLEEEYDMQRTWREDEDKCTFLIMDRKLHEKTGDELLALIGDTNLFLHHEENENNEKQMVAEAEIMIAEPDACGKGYGWEAMLLMLKYAAINLKINKFAAKIGMENERSLRMFKKLQFSEISRSEIFKEITLHRELDENWLLWLDTQVQLNVETYKS